MMFPVLIQRKKLCEIADPLTFEMLTPIFDAHSRVVKVSTSFLKAFFRERVTLGGLVLFCELSCSRSVLAVRAG